jgi:hypothetical protein
MGLFDKLKALVAGPPPPKAPLDHPILGELVYDHEVEGWRASVTTPAGPLPFLLYGDSEPSAAVLSRAEEIVRSSATFLQSDPAVAASGCELVPREGLGTRYRNGLL